jgi:hypothetical protein
MEARRSRDGPADERRRRDRAAGGHAGNPQRHGGASRANSIKLRQCARQCVWRQDAALVAFLQQAERLPRTR